MLYPQGERGAISLHFADVEYLKPDQMLNDSIIDFFLKFIHRELIPKERSVRFFISVIQFLILFFAYFIFLSRKLFYFII